MILRAAIIGILASAAVFAQERFDAATIKAIDLVGEGSRKEIVNVDPVTLTLRNMTLSSAIQWAYNVKYYQVTGPGWISDRRSRLS